MKVISPGKLWVGNSLDGSNYHQLFELDVRALVQLAAEEPPIVPPREFAYLRFPLSDGGGNEPWLLQAAVLAVSDLLLCGTPTLVFCGAGISRSPAVAAVALSITEGKQPEDCLGLVAKSVDADVSPELWRELLNWSRQRSNIRGDASARFKGT